MSIKITVPNTGSDYLTFGSGNTPTAAQIGGYDDGSSNGHLEFYTTASGTSTEQMRITSAGNVGIGTGSPSAKLQVNSAYSTDTTPQATILESGGGIGTAMFFGLKSDGTRWIMSKDGSASTAYPMAFYTGTSERARIDSSGNLLVGTTNASAKLAVEQTSATNAINANINYASSTNIAGIRVTKYDNNTTTSQRFVEFVINAGASGCGQINANGASTAAFGSYSDERLKENIVDLPSQLANICALRPVEFDYIGVEDGHQIGFIAQEMQQVYPDAVSVGNDEMLMITAWSKTEARLVKAIQEQQALITTLTERITALENK